MVAKTASERVGAEPIATERTGKDGELKWQGSRRNERWTIREGCEASSTLHLPPEMSSQST